MHRTLNFQNQINAKAFIRGSTVKKWQKSLLSQIILRRNTNENQEQLKKTTNKTEKSI